MERTHLTQFGNFNGEIFIYMGIVIAILIGLIPKKYLERSSKPFDKAVLRFREKIFR